MTHAYRLESFNNWISYALSDLARIPDRDMPISRSISIDMALSSLRHALRRANEMRDRERKAMCFRLMNRLRAELRACLRLTSWTPSDLRSAS